ncbi:hypothetical protein BGW36DRAFT_385527 [Talaromyces proteolyticus]|uniref:NmrA-like domain-containing protein n=1 Tax=Talaromyces proteolyticus TaxID=1131652 RepID=A0AAD4PXA6_9EURO|nr:uncharacterized protein BGW36DRAFT_385527 [Talaromyces proteolyticus]KAH8692926.1 hypothetical protein BGW36DRAFT_385527 [Talaromyces proteolyticus]
MNSPKQIIPKMDSRSVIVFGPTGAVGSAVARTAAALGAKVTLAMRNTSKQIAGLTSAEELSSGYKRVYADLADPDSLRVAVTEAGASHAYIYAMFQDSSDHMRPSAEALKAAGIKFVCLLSSFSVQGDIRAIQPSDPIAFGHAQVEVSLQEVFGPQGYVAIRPAFFASNTLWWRSQLLEGNEVKFPFPELKLDYISPEDIGAVCGTILAVDSGKETAVALVGPEELSVSDAIEIIGRAIEKEVKVTKVSQEEGIRILVTKSGLPEALANILSNQFAYLNDNQGYLQTPQFEEARRNIEKYLKRPPMRFSEWVDRNKEKFTAP